MVAKLIKDNFRIVLIAVSVGGLRAHLGITYIGGGLFAADVA